MEREREGGERERERERERRTPHTHTHNLHYAIATKKRDMKRSVTIIIRNLHKKKYEAPKKKNEAQKKI
jgi:hypothetical protein